jgi:transposase
MEACAYASALARYLKRHAGCTVYVLNPGKLAMTGKPARKTDREDARKTARFIQRYTEEEEFRSHVPLKGFLARKRTQTVNRLHALYTQAGITDLKKSSLAKAESREKQAARLPEPLRDTARILERQIQLYGERTGQKAGKHELATYVLPVPGAGMGTASAFPAYAGDGSRFSKPPEEANYTGHTNRCGHITKAGCRPLRAVVLQASRSLLRSKEIGGGVGVAADEVSPAERTDGENEKRGGGRCVCCGCW